MPSRDIAAQRRAALDQPNLSPNAVAEINSFWDKVEAREERRIQQMCDSDKQSLTDQIAGHEDKASEWIKQEFMPRLAAAKERRLSAKELAVLREDIAAFIRFYEGDGDRNKGLIHSLEASRDRIEEIREDPGAYADKLYRKFTTLKDGRFRLSKKDRDEFAPRHPLR